LPASKLDLSPHIIYRTTPVKNPTLTLPFSLPYSVSSVIIFIISTRSYPRTNTVKTGKLQQEKRLRIGLGYDIHRLAEGRHLILGGVSIPHDKGLLGHSDADVLLHALMDALLGAAALGDIGQHFPDTDPQYKGVSSLTLLEKVHQMLKAQGTTVQQLDSVIIAEQPRLAPYIQQMKTNIGRILELKADTINIKATTHEKIGPLGRGEAIAAQAVVLLNKA
jgi:2-C-methyl-D-erythritol 2,4-cyclodiphosphate synthase